MYQTNWHQMTDKEKMEWKYQRYMQDYLGSISSVDDNVGRVLDYFKEHKLEERHREYMSYSQKYTNFIK